MDRRARLRLQRARARAARHAAIDRRKRVIEMLLAVRDVMQARLEARGDLGAAGAPVAVCVHGLTRNGRDFDALARKTPLLAMTDMCYGITVNASCITALVVSGLVTRTSQAWAPKAVSPLTLTIAVMVVESTT